MIKDVPLLSDSHCDRILQIWLDGHIAFSILKKQLTS